MPGAGSADGVFAVGHDAQYRPVPVLGDQHLQVSGPGGVGLLLPAVVLVLRSAPGGRARPQECSRR